MKHVAHVCSFEKNGRPMIAWDNAKDIKLGDKLYVATKEPLEYWSVAEGWVKIDEMREHFDAVGCGTIYKLSGEGRSPLYTAPPKQWVGLTLNEAEDFYEKYTDRAELINAIDKFLEEKNT